MVSLPQTDSDVEIYSLQRLLCTILYNILDQNIQNGWNYFKDGINLRSKLLQTKLQKFAAAPSYRIPHVTIPQSSSTARQPLPPVLSCCRLGRRLAATWAQPALTLLSKFKGPNSIAGNIRHSFLPYFIIARRNSKS